MIVEFPSGRDSIRGAFYGPEHARPVPGVVVIPDVRGLYEQYHDVAKRLAAAGYAALALDLYTRGDQPDISGPESIFKFMRELPDERVLADIQAGIDFLHASEKVSERVGLTGFCMGGKYAFLAASSCAGISATIAWYGMLRSDAIDEQSPEHPLDALRRLSCPLLGLFGEDDQFIPMTDVEQLKALRAAHEIEVVSYPGAGHAFANDARPEAYRAEASEDAWRRALAFFERHLQA
ncbi:MAG: dienelactone hydrolase family protein [bacterium]|nr:dienelactone hydrolase family protein [bacterium]